MLRIAREGRYTGTTRPGEEPKMDFGQDDTRGRRRRGVTSPACMPWLTC